MAAVGRALLILGLVVAIYGLGASLYGARSGQPEWVDSGRRAMYTLAGLMAFAFVILDVAFVSSNFAYNIVAQSSSTTTPALYRAAAIWSTQQGSLLLWVLLLSCWSSLSLFLTRARVREIVPYAQAVMFGFSIFFVGLNTIFANPFATSAQHPTEGAGLDPLLRHTTMMIHPPMLYSGYTLLTVPFAFAIGALIARRTGIEWVTVTRRFALAAWLCLGVGILLGARWSYTELGWGGYWAWDPVENAALMPWLCCTAYIHSIMIQEKRGMLKIWNVSLILLTGTLAIVGTFLVRSGILSSIHAFVSDPTLNVSFVVLIAVMIGGSVWLVVSRRSGLRSEAMIDSLLSREAVFLFQNLVLVAMTAVIFWLTFFPLISEAITGTSSSVGPPAFQKFVVPFALLLVVLSGIGPIVAWRRVTIAKLRRGFAFPVAAALLGLLVLLLASDADRHGFALIMFVFGIFVVAAVGQEFARGIRARRAMTREAVPLALVSLVRRNRRRYGGYLVHAGVAVALIGVAASTSFQHSRYATLRPGQSAPIDGYTIRYLQPTATATSTRISLGARLAVLSGGHRVTTLQTQYEMYPSQDPTLGPIGRFFNGGDESRIGLDSGFTHDIWTAVDAVSWINSVQGLINQGDRLVSAALTSALKAPSATRTTALNNLFALRDAAIQALVQRFVTHPVAVTFLVIVSPLVMWLWLGALIAIIGGLIALWPMPPVSRRRRPVRVPPLDLGTAAPPEPVAVHELV
jgi:cytochrome c-type biogenesis protein CcmF